MSTTELIEAVLQLSPVERFILVDSVMKSLDKPDEDLNEVWLDEAERRLKAYDEGRLGAVPMEQVFTRIK
jgi:putative addiction module component (TIGR02574 family)